MGTLVIHDTPDDWGKEIIRHLQTGNGEKLRFVDLSEKKITSCIGCFYCWIRTPGLCRFRDDMDGILKEQIRSDRVLCLSPVTWGSYSPAMRTFQDRSLCLALPFFRKINGVTHHPPRYENFPGTVLAGYGKDLSGEECEVFRHIGNRLSHNLYKEDTDVLILQTQEDLPLLERALGGKEE